VTVFVTGGTGLVGSHVIEQLAARHVPVRAMVRDDRGTRLVAELGAEPVRGSVETPESWDAAEGAHAIVHAAALVVKTAPWSEYDTVNVVGTRLAVEAAQRYGARLVHISSVAVYGRSPAKDEAGTTSEDAPFGPIQPGDYYAHSKRAAEAVLWERARALGVGAVALRPCVVYGERDRAFMNHVLRILRWGWAPLVGGGDNRLAMVYAGNVAAAVLAALDRSAASGPFNVTNDGGLTQREFFEIAGRAMGVRVRFVRVPTGLAVAGSWLVNRLQRALRPGRYAGIGGSGGRFLARDNPYTSERAVRELGWRLVVAPREGLERTVRWFVGG
jgi:nucleoside-diphosphate-sugar epimerase